MLERGKMAIASPEFWNLCTKAFEAIRRGEWLTTRSLLEKAGDVIVNDPPAQQQERRILLERYFELLGRRESGSLDVNDSSVTRIHLTNGPVRLSLVTSVFNRLWQLQHTLPKNLESIRGRSDVELIVVDFGGTDSDAIAEFIDREFSFDLLKGQLRYYRCVTPWQRFHMATAKNAAHRLALGDLLFSVDADNFVTNADIDIVFENFSKYPDSVFHQTVGPAPLSHRMWDRYRIFPDASHYHNDEVIWDGSCGRIAVSRRAFERVNGYNENFIGMGMDDIDFLMRCIKTGHSYRHRRLNRSADSVFIDNGSARKEHQHSDNQSNWKRMDEALERNNLIPFYVTDSPPERFMQYRPCCASRSAAARVTLFASVFRAEPYLDRFVNDVRDILAGCQDALIWLLDVVDSHPPSVSEALRKLGRHERVCYVAVRHDPGLYELWNIAIRNIASRYTGNLNIDDLRGKAWLSACLEPLEANLADVASPVTVPFRDATVASHAAALAQLRRDGKTEERWFETRVRVRGEGVDARIEHVKLVDGDYDHGDLFQVLSNGTLTSYCIPNASAVWRRSVHGRAGYFDEQSYGCFADLALWAAAGAAGMRFRQVDYPALFFISEQQAHRTQARDDHKLWSLALRHASQPIRRWASRRLFDLSRIGGSYGNHHFLGWNWVRDRVGEHFVNTKGNVQLDMFVERSFFWNPNPAEREFFYQRNWLGFVHTTPHHHQIYSKKGQNLNSLLSDQNFLRSLEHCRGLIALSDRNRTFLESQIRAGGSEVPVFRLFHPNIPMDLGLADACTAEERTHIAKRVYHVGWHLRSFAPFARLAVDRSNKVLLVPKGISREHFLKEVVNADLALAGLGQIEEYVAEIYTASQEDYPRILRWGVIFNHYIEPAGSNLVSECISAESCLLLNRHKVFEEYLGAEYPLFFDTPEDADKLVGRLADPGFREKVRSYLRHLGASYSVGQFCRELERIGEHVYRS